LAILKRIKNAKGDGAGRSRYIVQKAVEIRTDIPSHLSLLSGRKLSPELRQEIANEYNRFLLLHQGDYRTQHFVVSFGHFLSDREIEKVLDLLQEIFEDSLRYHLFAVHVEKHGTAVHIVESASPDGKLRHLSQKEFHELKRRIIKKLSPFMNRKEKETARNYHRGISTQDWKSREEIQLAEKSWKEYIRQCVNQASKLIKNGEIEEAYNFLESVGIEIQEVEPGGLSPYGRRIRRKRTYAVYRHPQKGIIAIPMDKKMKATYTTYVNALEEQENEIEQIKEIIARDSEFETPKRESGERDKTTGGKEGRTGERNRTPGEEEAGTRRRNQKSGREEEIYVAELNLFIPAEGGTGEGDRKPQTEEGRGKDGTFGDREECQESGESEECSFYPDRGEKKGAKEFRIEHRQKEPGTHYCQPGTPGTARGREETEMVEESNSDSSNLSDIRLGGEILLHPTPENIPAYSNDKTVTGTEESTIRKTEAKESSTSENDFKLTGEHCPIEEEELKTSEKPHIPQEEEFTTSRKPDADTGPIEPLSGERDNGESSRTLESEDIGKRGESAVHPDSGRISDIPQEREKLGDNQGSLRDMRPSPGQGKWTINGEEITEDDIRENPALYTRCEIEEVQRRN